MYPYSVHHPPLPGNVKAQIWFQMSSKHESPLKENVVRAREYCFISSLWTDKHVGQDWLGCIFSHTVAMRPVRLTLSKDESAGLCQDMLNSPGQDCLPRGTSHTLTSPKCQIFPLLTISESASYCPEGISVAWYIDATVSHIHWSPTAQSLK